MPEDTLNPENIEDAATSALNSAEEAVENQPFSTPNEQVSPFTSQPTQVMDSAAQTAQEAQAAQTAQVPQEAQAASAVQGYTQPTQAYDAAQQVYADPAQQAYTNPNQQAYVDPNQQAYVDPNQQPYNQASYGQPVYGQPATPQYAQGANPGTTPMVLGILSIVFAGLIGLILSIIGLKKSGPVLAADPTNGRAKAGKVTSIIGLIFSILAMIFGLLMTIGLIFAANEVAENPDVLIESMEQIAQYDETGELQSEIDELKQELGVTNNSATDSDSAGNSASGSGSTNNTSSLGAENALAQAKDYLSYMPFSYNGLIEQLEYEKYSHEDAVYAADNCGADWNEQALLTAKEYLEYTAFSEEGLLDQLEYNGFTSDQAAYGVEKCGADWKEQAAKMAEEYLEYSSYSRDALLDQLVFEGFTQEQAEYGVSQAGY